MSEGRIPKQACVLRHLAFEDLGTFGPILPSNGFDVTVMDVGVDEIGEPILRSDLVVVLGGPIGVYEEPRYPFLTDELRALRRRLEAGLPTLGICLGAQLMAAALGARVYPGHQKEIGWAELQLSAAGMASCLRPLHGHRVLHWHGDTFELPAGATRLASTSLYENQAFLLGSNALALQFHPEIDGSRFEQWLIGHAAELSAANVDIAALRGSARELAGPLQGAGRNMLNQWLDGLRW